MRGEPGAIEDDKMNGAFSEQDVRTEWFQSSACSWTVQSIS